MTIIVEKVGGKIQRSKKQWKQLELSREVKEWLNFGAPLALKEKKPHPRIVKVVRSSKEAEKVLRDHVKEQLSLGFITKCEEPPTIVSPIFAIPKREKGKWRIILDLRYVNSFQQPRSFKTETIDSVKQQVRNGDWMTKGDLKHGFHHVGMRPEHSKYLGFQVGNNFYRYTTLPMGSSNSPYTFTKILRPVVKYVRETMKIRIIWYFDDFLILGDTKEEAEESMRKVSQLLKDLGWTMNEEKSIYKASQTMNFLGFALDTSATPKIKIPYQKKRNIRRKVLKLIKKAIEGPVWVKSVAKVAGLAQSITKAFSITPIFIRNLLNCIPKDMKRKNWDTCKVSLSKAALDDLSSWLEILYTWDGETFLPTSTDISINTDASNMGWGAIWNETGKTINGSWSEKWTKRHINEKELRTVLLMIRKWREHLRGKTILLRIDNKVAMAYVNRMTGRIPQLAKTARKIIQELDEVGAKIQAVFIGTKENIAADHLSRERDTHSWSVKESIFRKLEEKVGPHTMDWFASKENKKTKRFCARWNHPEAVAADALSISWKNENGWIVPPIPLIPKVVEKIKEEKAMTTIIIPKWTAQVWYQKLRAIATPIQTISMDQIDKNGAKWKNVKWSFEVLRTYGERRNEIGLKNP